MPTELAYTIPPDNITPAVKKKYNVIKDPTNSVNDFMLTSKSSEIKCEEEAACETKNCAVILCALSDPQGRGQHEPNGASSTA